MTLAARPRLPAVALLAMVAPALVGAQAVGPALAPNPWSSRNAISIGSEGLAAQARPATVKTARPASSTGRRPQRSDSGPPTSWPRAYPARKRLSVSWAVAARARNVCWSSGRAGRLMSMDRAVSAVSAASSSVKAVVPPPKGGAGVV